MSTTTETQIKISPESRFDEGSEKSPYGNWQNSSLATYPPVSNSMSSLFGFVSRFYLAINPPTVKSVSDTPPLKFGILGTEGNSPLALITPAKSHPEVQIYAIASRSQAKAKAFAKKHRIKKIYAGAGSYQRMLDDPKIQAVYNPLPNTLHYEWTMKALRAGKHVLVESAFTMNAKEAKMLVTTAQREGLVLLEGVHTRFHPVIHYVRAILDSGELGKIESVDSSLVFPRGTFSSRSRRMNYDLGGGALIDLGTYLLHNVRYINGANPVSVLSASHVLYEPTPRKEDQCCELDRRISTTLSFANHSTATLTCDLGEPPSRGVLPNLPRATLTVRCEGGELQLNNFFHPNFYHNIVVYTGENSSCRPRKRRVEKVYTWKDCGMEGKGEDWWTTYRYQLEAFVDRVKGRTPSTWIEGEDTVANMEWIEKIYAKAGLRNRYQQSTLSP